MRRCLFLLPWLFCVPALQAQNCVANPSPCSTTTGALVVTITIGPVFQLDITPATTALAAPTPAMYDAGKAATNGPTATIRSNAPWTLAISSSLATWTATNTQTEPAWTAKPSTDLQWSIAAGGPWSGVTTTAAAVKTGTATAGTAVPLYYQTLYSWANDTPGNYSLTVVFTITSP